MNRKCYMYRKIAIFIMAIIMAFTTEIHAFAGAVTVVSGISNVSANTSNTSNAYSSHWQYWSQGASQYSGMRSAGCRVTAFAKLIKEAGYAEYSNPDEFLLWGISNGFFQSTSNVLELGTFGNAISTYISQKGGTCTLVATNTLSNTSTDIANMMNYMNQGYYIVLSSAAHTAYIGKDASISQGTPVILDSWYNWSTNSATSHTYTGSYDSMSKATFEKYRVYSISKKNADTTPPTISNVRVTDVSSDGYTVNCDVTDNVGVERVSFPTWSAVNGQDDLSNDWYNVCAVYKPTSGNTYSYRVDIKNHNNDVGKYTTHIYAYDAAGNYVSAGIEATISVPLTSFTLNATQISLTRGETKTLSVTAYTPSNTTSNKTATWSSENTAVATVDSSGKVTAKAAGTTNIVCTVAGVKQKCKVTVKEPTYTDGWYYVSTLPSDITSTNYEIQYQHTYQQYATSSPGTGWTDTGVDKKEYTKSGTQYESALPLSTSDTVKLENYYYYHFCGGSTGVNANFAQTTTYGHFDEIRNVSSVSESASYKDVDDSRYTYYRLKWSDGSDAYCNTSKGTCDGTYGSHANRSYYWYKMYVYQNYTVKTLNQYQMMGGWTATKDSTAASVTYRYRVKPTGVSLNNTSVTLNQKGATVALVATISPSGASDRTVTWKSSNTSVATVNTVGVITAVANGTTTITATVADKSASCTVKVSIETTEVPNPTPTLPFTDVPQGSWYHDYVVNVYEKGYMVGSGTTFKPAGLLTRAEIVTTLYSMSGKPATEAATTFPDVASGQWYSTPISWAYRNNIASGYANGKFGTTDLITREQFAVMLYQYAASYGYNTTCNDSALNGYTDTGSISSWANTAMKWAVSNGIISGKTATTLDPKGNATRAECATMITKLGQLKKN